MSQTDVITEGDVSAIVLNTLFQGKPAGTLIEVGAARPDFLSIGASFQEAAWRVLFIEPNPSFSEMHRALGHDVLQVACADYNETDQEFKVFRPRSEKSVAYLGEQITGESFSSLGTRERFADLLNAQSTKFDEEIIRVEVKTLKSILDQRSEFQHLDVLSIDVEGWEYEVLNGLDLENNKPNVIIYEELFSERRIPQLLENHGFVLWKMLSPNKIYVRRKFLEDAGQLPATRRTSGLAASRMNSYAPNFEDVLLRRCFWDVVRGFYVDIGARHPNQGSVTKSFYDRGWSGINVEPSDGFKQFAIWRILDRNVRAFVSGSTGGTTPFDPGAISPSSSVPESASGGDEIDEGAVPATTLDALVRENVGARHVNFIRIDAAGNEGAIINAADWTAFRPEIVLVRSTAPGSNERRVEDWQNCLESNGYRFAYFDGISDFWVRRESDRLLEHFAHPVNALDNFHVKDAVDREQEAKIRELERKLAQAT